MHMYGSIGKTLIINLILHYDHHYPFPHLLNFYLILMPCFIIEKHVEELTVAVQNFVKTNPPINI